MAGADDEAETGGEAVDSNSERVRARVQMWRQRGCFYCSRNTRRRGHKKAIQVTTQQRVQSAMAMGSFDFGASVYYGVGEDGDICVEVEF